MTSPMSKQMRRRRRKPLDILSHFFRRKTSMQDDIKISSDSIIPNCPPPSSMPSTAMEIIDTHTDIDIDTNNDNDSDEFQLDFNSLTRFRNLQKDVEALRLSRHDNPVVQRKLASHSSEVELETSSASTSFDVSFISSITNNKDDEDEDEFLNRYKSFEIDNEIANEFNDIRRHLVRSPPPCMSSIEATLMTIGVGLRVGDGDSDSVCHGDVTSDHGRTARMTPLPHVRQSCPMFRPVQRGIFQDGHRRKQSIDLRPLLSRSIDDVIDVKSRSLFWDAQYCHRLKSSSIDKEHQMSNYGSESAPNSPQLSVSTRRQRHQSNSNRPITYPSQQK